jgi:hypothetical protein
MGERRLVITMNPQYFGYILMGILISGTGMSLCALIATIILTSVRPPRLYQLLRFGMTTAGFSLSTFMLAAWIVISLLFESSLSSAEVQTLWIGIVSFSIPMVMGALAAIGPKYPAVLWLGRIVNGITPFAAFWVTSSSTFGTNNSEPVFWLLLYFVVASLWWEGLVHWDRKLQKQRRLQLEGNLWDHA